ncbi:CoF synthetase [Aquimarina sp. RZ0]|uniref:CoF synthetase n=1 Tax=Aquimarina sp. RZ0 TaxID=2607730 RepID=UPI0011F344EB|nr:CoF synthetase [Aquimarina sp. RZ0]KAA1246938.1 CoF synthetase [Aquimarina sp. RZ0]
MKVAERVRKNIFWFIDSIRGGKIRRHYNEVKYITEHFDQEFSKEKREEYLRKLLIHAANTTEFYGGMAVADILNFPIINKDTIRSFPQKFKSVKYFNKRKVSVSTSGSTGASFTVYQDLNKKYRNIADVIYFSEIIGFHVGYRLFYLRFWNMFKKKNKIQSLLQNIVPIDVFDLSPKSIKDLISRLSKDTSNKGMLGYASSYNKICTYLDSINSDVINCNLKSAVGISERLNKPTKVAMKKYFNVDMVSRYSNAENGLIAQQPQGEDFFEINEASYYVEILSLENDKRLQPGELGRIVITDLFNYNMPIIRYDTGDIGIMDFITVNNKTKLVFTRVEGRKMDMIRNTSGEILSTSILLIINKYKEIKQRQIIQQTKNEYLFKLKIESNTFDKQDEFIEEFRGYLGDDAIIRLEFVKEIPLLASGKHRAIVNKVKI